MNKKTLTLRQIYSKHSFEKIMKKKYLFESTVKVRDFECDMQGVVNNAYYHNLLEQTRTEFFESIGIDTREWSQKFGVDFVVYETAIQYRSPIQSGETFRSCLNMQRVGARFVFFQDFRHEDNDELCIKARVDVVVGINGKLTKGDYLADYLKGKVVMPVIIKNPNHSPSRIDSHNEDFIFNYEMKVRDYECNRFGSATNTFVQHYLEVTRLEFMEYVGETFREWHEQGIDMMVSKIDVKFIQPMMSAQTFRSLMNIKQDGPRAIFVQEIRRKDDNRLCIRAVVEVVALVHGQLEMGNVFDEFMHNVAKKFIEIYKAD